MIWQRFWRKCNDKTLPFGWYYGYWSSSQYLSPGNCRLANTERPNNRLRAIRISSVKMWHCCSTCRAAGFVRVLMVLPGLWHRRVDETKFGAEPRHLIRSASYVVKTSTAIKYTVSLPEPGPVTHMSNGRLPRNRPYPNRGTRSTVWSPPRLDTFTHLTICKPQYVLIRLSVSIPGNER